MDSEKQMAQTRDVQLSFLGLAPIYGEHALDKPPDHCSETENEGRLRYCGILRGDIRQKERGAAAKRDKWRRWQRETVAQRQLISAAGSFEPCCPAAFLGKSHHSLAVTRVGFCFYEPPWPGTAAREEVGRKLNLSPGQVKRKARRKHLERDKLEKNFQGHVISQQFYPF